MTKFKKKRIVFFLLRIFAILFVFALVASVLGLIPYKGIALPFGIFVIVYIIFSEFYFSHHAGKK